MLSDILIVYNVLTSQKLQLICYDLPKYNSIKLLCQYYLFKLLIIYYLMNYFKFVKFYFLLTEYSINEYITTCNIHTSYKNKRDYVIIVIHKNEK